MEEALKYVLVVDDDPTMQMILQGMVEKSGHKVAIAENGQKALQFLEIGQGNISCLLLDYNLPDMDGMDVVKALENNELSKGVPVIMQSGSSKLEQIRQAIDGGVYSYLTKPFPIEALQSVLDMALERAAVSAALKQRVKQGYAPANLIRSAAFVMKTRANARSLSILLSTLFPEPGKVFPGLLAVMLNAIEHGTLEIGYEHKAELVNKGEFVQECTRLEGLQKNQKKEVEVQFIQKDGRLSVRITDQGEGFGWQDYVDFSIERQSFVNGFGMLKALHSFDEVKYNAAGNQVMVSVFET